MRDHSEPDVRWMYSRLKAHSRNVADISDCGMLFFLLVGDDEGSPKKFEAFIGDGIIDRSTQATITLEAESMERVSGWQLAESDAASGGSYLLYDGPNSFAKVTSHRIKATFEVETAGRYSVKWNMRQPDGVPGDQANDAWICFTDATQLARQETITGFHKFVGRSKDEFALNGQLDLEGDQPWMTVEFPKPGKYHLEIAGRSNGFQLDRVVLYKGIDFEQLKRNLQ
ncbi:hypothetical protein [Mariniblastus fucicola]|uniref:hypothetical protein n=1 Tax=Mariniblastus fucicola TaxID=980251 RepID=UPI001EE4939C|nr:hypothetical protein [Mariniblastus fucicola]